MINLVFINSEHKSVPIIVGIIAFLIIRLGIVFYLFESRDTVIEPDDSYTYLQKAQTLFLDSKFQSEGLSNLKVSINGDPRQTGRVLTRYHLMWSLTVGGIHQLTGITYESIWWILLAIGQILLLLGFYRVLVAVGMNNQIGVLALILYALVQFGIGHATTMAPREWAFIVFLFLLADCLTLDKRLFAPTNYYCTALVVVLGCLTHPRFFILLTVLLLFIIVYYRQKIKWNSPFLNYLVVIISSVLVVIISNIISTKYFYFPFLGFSSDVARPGSVLGNLSSAFLSNLLPAIMIISSIVGSISFFYADGMLLIILGIIVSHKYYKILAYFLWVLVAISGGMLFLNFKGYPAEYFFFCNSIFALILVLFEAIGIYTLVNFSIPRKRAVSFLLVSLFLLGLSIAQFSLGGTKVLAERYNMPKPHDFIVSSDKHIDRSEPVTFIDETLMYAYLLYGNYDRKLYYSGLKDAVSRIIAGRYSLPLTKQGLPLKKGDYVCFKFDHPLDLNMIELEMETDYPDFINLELSIQDEIVFVLDLSKIRQTKTDDKSNILFDCVRITNSGNSIAYLKKCVNVEADNQSVWPVRMGYSIEYQTNEINHSWRGVFLYSLFSQNEIYEQKKRIYIFKTNYLDKKLNILMNNGYYYIAKIE